MSTKQFLVIGCTLLMAYTGISQVDMRKMANADKKFKKQEYADAQEMYLNIVNGGYKSEEVLMRLGDSYYFNGDLENALEWYAELITRYTDYPDDYLFRYAQTLRHMQLYKQGYDMMRKYYYRKDLDPALLLKKSTKEYLKHIDQQSGQLVLQNFPHNTVREDFAPQFGVSGNLMFSSTRNPVAINESLDIIPSGANFFELAKDEIPKIDKNLNSNLEELSLVLTKNRDTMYFTRSKKSNDLKKRAVYQKSSEIYRAVRMDGRWCKIKKLNLGSANYSYMHPALSPDGTQLYFASDYKTGNGTLDLFVVDIKKNGLLGVPKRLDDSINTLGDESFPFIAPNGDLFFASNGHFGLGGYDMFVCKLKAGIYQSPDNLGKPINSTHDDISFVFDGTVGLGYFASNRKEEAADFDIYEFRDPNKVISGCSKTLFGSVVSADGKQKISRCKVALLDEKYQKIDQTTTDYNGRYYFQVDCSKVYFARLTKPEFHTVEEMFYADNKEGIILKLNTKLTTGNGVVKNWMVKGTSINNSLGMSKIYFDSNKTKIRTDAEIELQKIINLLQNHPELKVHIRSHTDSKGDPKFNKNLSQKRALKTKKYIVEKGNINTDRIIAQGFGASNPIIKCNQGCSEEELQINRRSEFVVFQK